MATFFLAFFSEQFPRAPTLAAPKLRPACSRSSRGGCRGRGDSSGCRRRRKSARARQGPYGQRRRRPRGGEPPVETPPLQVASDQEQGGAQSEPGTQEGALRETETRWGECEVDSGAGKRRGGGRVARRLLPWC
jgi:hypothetical protein